MKPNSTTDEKRKLKMRDLTEMTGLPASTVHLYMRMGLLPEPIRPSRNQAWYDEEFVERLQLIRTLTEAHIPLSSIKETLENMPDPGGLRSAAAGLAEARTAILDTLRAGPGTEAEVTRADLLKQGVQRSDFDVLMRLELISPIAGRKDQRFSALDARIALAFVQLRESTLVGAAQPSDGLANIIAAFARYLKAMANAEGQEIARLLLGNADKAVGADEDFLRAVILARDELVAAIHWKELYLALDSFLGEGRASA